MSGSVVVLGASGGIGRVIVRELISAGRRVVAVGRSHERLETLAQRVATPERLAVLPGSVATEAEAAALAQALRSLPGPITSVVASLRGPISSGRLLDRPAEFLSQALEQKVVSHFIAAKYLLPVLADARPDGLYLWLSGPWAECAWAGYGQVSVAAAALQMLMRVLREEAKELAVSMQQLQIGVPVRTETNTSCACPDWISADDVAREVVGLIEGPRRADPVIRFGGYQSPHAQVTANPAVARRAP